MKKCLYLLVKAAVVIVLLFCVAETLADWLTPYETLAGKKYSAEASISQPWSSYVGDFHPPNLKRVQFAQVNSQKLVTAFVYSTDAVGRRNTPQGPGPFRSSSVFFGCSVTFGRGLNDDQTLPFHFGKLNPDQKIYNYGRNGSGPHQMLAWIETGLLKNTLAVAPSTFIYVFIADHFHRVSGGFYDDQDLPDYELKDGVPRRLGLFREIRPLRALAYKLIRRTRLYGWMELFAPAWVSKTDERLLCEIVARSRDLLKKDYPESRFVVFDLDQSGQRSLVASMQSCAKEKKLELVEYRYSGPRAAGFIDTKFDLHPSEASNEAAARKLTDALRGR